MSEPGSTGERICPVCDESVPSDAKTCPSCSTDLTLFQVNGQRVVLEEDIEVVGQSNGHVGDLLKAAEEDPFANMPPTETQPTAAQPAGEEELFECPECNALIPIDAASCPNCGVEFAEGDVFECPLCQTLVDINVDKCPNCGAEFAEDEEEEAPAAEAAPVPAPEVPKPEPAPEPITEPPKEMSFAERMKAMKEGAVEDKTDDSATAATVGQTVPKPAEEPQPKEMSFAERMKAMKEGKAVDSQAASTSPTPAPTAKPAEEKTTPAVKPGITETPKPAATPAPVPETPAQSKEKLKEKYKELPVLIGEVKKYLAVAKKCGIDVSKSRALINQAVAAGKNKDLETAVKLVEEGKAGIEKTINSFMDQRIKALTMKVEEANKSGASLPEAANAVVKIKESLAANDYDTVLIEIEKTESMLKDSVGEEVLDARTELKIMESTINDATALNIELGEAMALYTEAKKSADAGDWNAAAQYSKQAQDSLQEILPNHIATAMKKAKTSLLEIKMMNVDITQPVEFLKNANIAVKDGKYGDALHCVRQFKEFLDKENFEF